MLFDATVRDTISAHMGFSVHDLTVDELKKIVRDKPLNIIHLVTGKGVITFPDDVARDTTSAKLARVLNIILMDHFDNVPEFLATIGADYPYILDIWTSDIRKPKYTMLRKLIKTWDIDPLFLYGTKQSQYITSN